MRKPSGEDFFRAFEVTRNEAHKYHEMLWKIVFAAIALGSGVIAINFAPHSGGATPPLSSRELFLLSGGTVTVIGIVTVILVHLYWFQFQATLKFGNQFRTGWLQSLPPQEVAARLGRRWEEAQRELKFAIHKSVAWAAPGWIMIVAGLTLMLGLSGISCH